jgi:outer membrane biosynthesis protein TonB
VKVAAAAARPAPRKIGKSAAAAAPENTEVALADEPAPMLTADLSGLVDHKAPGSSEKPAAVARPDQVAKEVVARVMAKYRPQVIACRDKANAAKAGAVTVSMTVDPSGAVSRPQVTSSFDSPEVSGCILKAASAWRFPKREGGQPARTSYKFALR